MASDKTEPICGNIDINIDHSTMTCEQLLQAYKNQLALNQRLQQELDSLKKQLNESKISTPLATSNMFSNLFRREYSTDEEQLEELTFVSKEKQDRKRRRTKTKSPKNDKADTVSVKNALPKADHLKSDVPQKPKSPPLPPATFVSHVEDFVKFKEGILKVAPKAQFKAISKGEIKLTVTCEAEYRAMKKKLEELRSGTEDPIQFHTHQLKSERLFRVVFRGLPHSVPIDELKEAVEQLGYQVAAVTNIQKSVKENGGKIKVRFPLFFIDLQPNENNKEIYKLKDILHCKITVEPPRKVKGTPQCSRCQRLGHTKSFCHRDPRCVKCAGDHVTANCAKSPDNPVKCVLCDQFGHPANYKGCPEYQKMLKRLQTSKTPVTDRVQGWKKNSVVPQNNPNQKGLNSAKQSQRDSDKTKFVQKTVSDEPTLADIMKQIRLSQAETSSEIRQLTKRMEKLENANPSNNNSKKNKKSKSKNE